MISITTGIPQDVFKELQRIDDREKYRTKVDKKRLSLFAFDESRYSRDEDSIEYQLNKKEQLKALYKAIGTLTEDELQLINECFFDETKPNYTKLAKQYGISRQLYSSRLKKVLTKLRLLVEIHLNDG